METKLNVKPNDSLVTMETKLNVKPNDSLVTMETTTYSADTPVDENEHVQPSDKVVNNESIANILMETCPEPNRRKANPITIQPNIVTKLVSTLSFQCVIN